MELVTVRIEKPDDVNLILGQSHFIKTVEDIHETMVQTVPGIKFGLAFCESSGEMLVRWTGTDDSLIELTKRNALALSAGHSFILLLGTGFFPVNVLNAIKIQGSIVGTHHDLEEVFELHRRGLTRVEYAERRLADVNRAIEEVLDGTAPAPRLVFRMQPPAVASGDGHGVATVAATGS
jgi:adenosine/AMP kinase